MSDIFISYNHEDQLRAQELAEALGGRGWSIFWDRTIPYGKTWRDTIGRELSEARCVIVLWSKTSVRSEWVRDEADDARQRRVLVPVRIDNIQPPIGFRGIQTADLVNWNATEPTHAFDRLIADIAALIGSASKETDEQVRRADAEEVVPLSGFFGKRGDSPSPSQSPAPIPKPDSVPESAASTQPPIPPATTIQPTSGHKNWSVVLRGFWDVFLTVFVSVIFALGCALLGSFITIAPIVGLAPFLPVLLDNSRLLIWIIALHGAYGLIVGPSLVVISERIKSDRAWREFGAQPIADGPRVPIAFVWVIFFLLDLIIIKYKYPNFDFYPDFDFSNLFSLFVAINMLSVVLFYTALFLISSFDR